MTANGSSRGGFGFVEFTQLLCPPQLKLDARLFELLGAPAVQRRLGITPEIH
jgi:hypothetical protein